MPAFCVSHISKHEQRHKLCGDITKAMIVLLCLFPLPSPPQQYKYSAKKQHACLVVRVKDTRADASDQAPMAPTSSAEPEVKHITLHQFLKQQHLLQHRLKPTVMWSWAAAAAGTGRPAQDDAADDDDVLGDAWPPRSYTCAFCRREFKSAQALGGHMNVHRRDRAKMRGHNSAGKKLVAAAPASEDAAHAAVAPAEYAVLYPILNSNAAGAVLIPGGDVLLSSTPLALAPAHGHCHVSDDEDDKEVDLELRLWWP